MSTVWKSAPYKAEKLLVLLACADWANERGECWPSYKQIAEKARTTERGAKLIIQQLIDDGCVRLVETGGGRGQRNQYKLNFKAWKDVEKGEAHSSNKETENGEADSTNGERETPNKKHRMRKNGERESRETVNEKAENGERESSAYKEVTVSKPSIDKPSINPGDSVNPLLPLLIERYKNIICKPEDETQLQFQAEELRGKGVTVEQLTAWLAWRRVSPDIRYIAEKVLMWTSDQQRESQQGGTGYAKTQSGSTTDHKAIVSKFRSNRLGG